MLLATSLKRSCLAKKTIIVKNVTVNIEPLMRMRKAVFKNGHAKIVYVMNGWNRFKASRDFMEWFEGLAATRRWPRCPSPRRSFRREPPASPWSSSTDAARLRRRLLLWWARCARLRGSRRNNRRSEALSIWTNASR